MKNFGIGCGVFFAAAIVAAMILPENTASSVIAYAFLLSIVLLIVSIISAEVKKRIWGFRAAVWGLSIGQVISVALVALGLAVLAFVVRRRGDGQEAGG